MVIKWFTYNVPLRLSYFYEKRTIHCTVEPIFIKISENALIAANCNKSDLFCSFNYESFIWNTSIIKKSKYELVKNVSFLIDGKVFLSNFEKIMVISTNNFKDEGMDIINSTSSFYLIDLKYADNLDSLRTDNEFERKLIIINKDYRDNKIECDLFLNTIHEPFKILKIFNDENGMLLLIKNFF